MRRLFKLRSEVLRHMLQVAIVEDQESERKIMRDCLDYLSAQENVQFNIREFSSGLAFLGNFEPVYDIVLMDIEMPGMDGMAAARAMRKIDSSVILVFVTSFSQYAVQGYDVDALSFIVKPVNKYDFAMKMSRAIARTTKRLGDTVTVRTDRESFVIRASDIRYLDVSGHYVVYHTTEGDLMEYTTLKDAEKKIGKDYFVRCNRWNLINLRYVTEIRNDTVYIRDEAMPISRSQKKAFLTAFADFMGGVN